jgi:hypothetical protein
MPISGSPCPWLSKVSTAPYSIRARPGRIKGAYDAAANRLVGMFIENFAKFEDHVDGSVLDAAPGFKAAAE